MSELAKRNCIPRKQGDPRLGPEAIALLSSQLGGGWQVIDDHHLQCEYDFPDFALALAYANRIGELAEEQNHHPDIHLSWGKVKLVIFTHVVGGLSESDFVWAAKADARL